MVSSTYPRGPQRTHSLDCYRDHRGNSLYIVSPPSAAHPRDSSGAPEKGRTTFVGERQHTTVFPATRKLSAPALLPSRKEGTCDAGVERAWGDGTVQVACTGMARLMARGQGTRGAHVEQIVEQVMSRDLGHVEAERLVELGRALPSRMAGMRCGRRSGPGGGRACGAVSAVAACTGRVRLKAGWVPGHARSAPRTCRTCP